MIRKSKWNASGGCGPAYADMQAIEAARRCYDAHRPAEPPKPIPRAAVPLGVVLYREHRATGHPGRMTDPEAS